MNAPVHPLLRAPDRIRPGEPRWLTARRRAAAAHLREEGLPTAKHEAWRFTSLRALERIAFQPAAEAEAPGWLADAFESGPLTILSVDGRPLLGAPIRAPGLEIALLSELCLREPEALAPWLAAIAPNDALAALNTLRFDEALVVRVEKGARIPSPLHLVHASRDGGAPTVAYPRTLVIAGAGSELLLVESHLGRAERAPSLCAPVTELRLGTAARVEHVRVHHGSATGYALGSLAVWQERDSVYVSRVATLGGALFRLDARVTLAESGAECRLEGIYHAGPDEHVDHHTFVRHDAPHTQSFESYRGIVGDRGVAVFDGIIAVGRDAQRTSAHQENRNLLLGDRARVHSKPHLDIEADDVSCTHGAAVGALDDDQLFYLRSRGLGEAQARALLTYGFVKEQLDALEPEATRRRFARHLLERLPFGAEARELIA